MNALLLALTLLSATPSSIAENLTAQGWEPIPDTSLLAAPARVALGADAALVTGPRGSAFVPDRGLPIAYATWPRFETLFAADGAVFGVSASPPSWPQSEWTVFAWRPGLEWQFSSPCPITHLAASGDQLFLACADGTFALSRDRGMTFERESYPPPARSARVETIGISPEGWPAIFWRIGKRRALQVHDFSLGALRPILTTTQTHVLVLWNGRGWSFSGLGEGARTRPHKGTTLTTVSNVDCADAPNNASIAYASGISVALVCGDKVRWSRDRGTRWEEARFPGPVTFAAGGGNKLLIEAAGRRWIHVVGG